MPTRYFSKKTVLKILAIQNKRELEPAFQEPYLTLSNSVLQHLNRSFKKHNKALWLLDPLTNLSIYPLLIIWTLIGLAEFSVISLAVITSIGMIFMIALSVVAFISTSREHNKQKTDIIENITLLQGKLLAINNYLFAKPLMLIDINHSFTRLRKNAMVAVKQQRIESLKKGLEITALVTYTLFSTYYLGVSAFSYAFGALGASSMMIGPIGLLLALGIALLFGIYFGINQYQKSCEEVFCLEYEKELSQTLENKCRQLDKHLLPKMSHSARATELRPEKKSKLPVYSSNTPAFFIRIKTKQAKMAKSGHSAFSMPHRYNLP